MKRNGEIYRSDGFSRSTFGHADCEYEKPAQEKMKSSDLQRVVIRLWNQGRSLLLNGVNADLLLVTAETLETNDAAGLGEQGVILADAYIEAGMDVGAALANKNVAGQYKLTIRTLGSKTLAFAVTAVAGGAHTFFMSEQLKIKFHHDGISSVLTSPHGDVNVLWIG